MEEDRLVLKPTFKNIYYVEKLINNSINISDDKRNAALIIATEIFDNIVDHSVSPEGSYVIITISHSQHTKMVFSYETSNFQDLIEGVRRSRPHYDPEAGRYRGMGLRMTRYLSSHVIYQDNEPLSSITIYL